MGVEEPSTTVPSTAPAPLPSSEAVMCHTPGEGPSGPQGQAQWQSTTDLATLEKLGCESSPVLCIQHGEIWEIYVNLP